MFASSAQSATGAHGQGLLLGALLGLALAMVIAYVIYKLGRRLNLGLFFRVIGVVLMVFAAGLLADAVEDLQQLGWLPFLGHTLWNTSSFLSEGSSLGDVFHSLLGYADRPSVLQLLVWVTYVSVSVTLFIRMGRRARKARHRQWGTGPPRPRSPWHRRGRSHTPDRAPLGGELGSIPDRPPGLAGLASAGTGL